MRIGVEVLRTRLRAAAVMAVTIATVALTACTAAVPPVGTPLMPTPAAQDGSITGVVQQAMADYRLRAAIVEVTRDGQVLARQALGESMSGVPADPDMHFRNGAVAFAYLGTLLMRYVDAGKVSLDDTVDQWLPDLPEAGTVTLKMLADQTSGYPDYETDPGWTAAFNADPFHVFTYDERIAAAFSRPMQFAPGTNWSYSHTNFMILGKILAMVGKAPLDALLQREVLTPMGLTQTRASDTSLIPEPALHAYSSERRGALGIAAGTAFTEESTYWSTVWGTPDGANQTTTIDDLTATAVAVGTGSLLSEASYRAMTGPNLLGFGHRDPSCAPSCFTQVDGYNFGLGVVRSGDWIIQNPMLSGYSAVMAYLPSQKLSIAVAVTYLPGAFDCEGIASNSADTLFRLIGAAVAGDEAPPMPPDPHLPTGCP